MHTNGLWRCHCQRTGTRGWRCAKYPLNSDTVVGEFRTALDTLSKTLLDTQCKFMFCFNPNDSWLSNQLEGWSVKGQIWSLGLMEISKRNINIYKVGLTLDEFCTWYREPMAKMGVVDGLAKEKVEQTKGFLGLPETDMVLSQYKVHSAGQFSKW